jgi:hypothetical protein
MFSFLKSKEIITIIKRLENIEGTITMYKPEVGEYRRGNHNVQPRGWRIPKGQTKCTISEVGEYRRGNHNVQSRGWGIPKGQSKCTISEVGEYRRGNHNGIVHCECPFGILHPLRLYILIAPSVFPNLCIVHCDCPFGILQPLFNMFSFLKSIIALTFRMWVKNKR